MTKQTDDGGGEKGDKPSGPVTFRHVRDGRRIKLRSNATNQIATYERHPNWERVA